MIHNNIRAGANAKGTKTIQEEFQMSHPVEAWVKAHLAHFICARQEEVDYAVGDHAVWKASELVVEALLLPEAVPKAWGARLHT